MERFLYLPVELFLAVVVSAQRSRKQTPGRSLITITIAITIIISLKYRSTAGVHDHPLQVAIRLQRVVPFCGLEA